ncbi:MAG TPA: GntR family transcriptional regulator [Anaerolineales bacterium]|nr:GntR family transcriptional regulator [Anaerolineales bacterium]
MNIIQSKSVVNQVDEILLGRIRSGTYAPGSRIPSESELSEEMGVSRATIRTTLAKLATSGLIIRKQGDGTYVNARVREISANTGNLWDLVQLIESNGYKPSIRSLAVEVRPATEKEALTLAVEAGEDLLLLRRLFLADERPVILANNVIPRALLRESIENIDGGLHIRDILFQYCHQKIGFAITDIRAVLADSEVRTILGSAEGNPLLELQVGFFDKNNIPLALGVNYFDDSFLQLSLVQTWN